VVATIPDYLKGYAGGVTTLKDSVVMADYSLWERLVIFFFFELT
jgi:hypothetical protein